MKRLVFLMALLAAGHPLTGGAPFVPAVSAQRAESTGVRPHPLAPAEIDRIVRTLSANETRFRQALNQYSFKREAVIQTLGMGGQISGEYNRVSNFVFDDAGRRYERIVFFPMPTLDGLQLTPEDLEDLGGIQPFALEAAKIDQYSFNYLGKERIDELDLYVFDVTPKVLSDPKRVKLAEKNKERYFQGRVWVDMQDLQIVKAQGKGVPEGKQRFPTFETYREQVDGKYWFPTYTYADETLVFPSGQAVRFRMRVRYTDYRLPKATVEVIADEGEDAPKPEPQNAPAKKP